jgi:tetratricopeptide (TPR) repeat protein
VSGPDETWRAEAAAVLADANAQAAAGRLLAALAGYDRFLALAPDFAPAHSNRSHVLERLGRAAEALSSADRAIALKTDYAEAHNSRAAALRSLGRPLEALESCERALALKPALADALGNRGGALYDLGRAEAALAAFDAAIALAPGSAAAHCNRGAALYRLARPRGAIASYRRALELDPLRADARHQMGQAALLAGDFEVGWRFFEARKDVKPENYPWRGHIPDLAEPKDLSAAAVLACHEQGFGDTIQFCRYVGKLEARCPRVVFVVPAQLERLMVANFPAAAVTDRVADVSSFDTCAALMSLPLALGLEPIVSSAPYLRADPTLAQSWEARLGERRLPRVGLAWAGAASHGDDRNRSAPLAILQRLLREDADWVSLQKDLRPGDAEGLVAAGIARHGEILSDFADTAALIDRLDLVITVDTAVAHLAGALGKPVWIMLAFSPDWRWLLGRYDSPWYGAARLFRQPAPGDWAAVIDEVTQALAKFRQSWAPPPESV